MTGAMTNRAALSVLGALLGLAGCMAGPGPLSSYYGPNHSGAGSLGASAQLARAVSVGQALVRLPDEAGAVLTVVERRSDDMIVQEIAFKADASALGENEIRIAIGHLNDGDSVLGPAVAPARSSDIAAEMRSEFSGWAMRVSQEVARNAYGPFGYAAGTKGRIACLYAWQFIPNLGEGSGPLPSVFAVSRSAALRIRLCRADVPWESLRTIMEGMSMVVPPRAAIIYPVQAPAGADALGSIYPTY